MSKLIPIACLASPDTAGYASTAPSATTLRISTTSGIRYEMKM